VIPNAGSAQRGFWASPTNAAIDVPTPSIGLDPDETCRRRRRLAAAMTTTTTPTPIATHRVVVTLALYVLRAFLLRPGSP
jgi:hypothetical protein